MSDHSAEQDEIQSAHWSNKQITVFNGVVWFLNDGTVERRSFALVTDYLGHVGMQFMFS